MTEEEYLVLLSTFIAFGPARIKLLLKYFKSAKKIWKAGSSELKKVGLKEEKIEEFNLHRSGFNEVSYFKNLAKLKIEAISFKNKRFPKSLSGLRDAPFLLYLKGNLKVLDLPSVAIVGSRKMTSYGREVTEKFAGELASFGVVIISGLARGVDTAAHKAALGVDGKTIAILGCGLDSVYPPENSELATMIVRGGGALVSEYPLGYPALPINFASRNRIISGLSKAVLVIEGAARSGTLLTASHAAEQGREVFAIPGQITSPLSAAPFYLIKNGAKMATTPSDILEELDLQIKVDKEAVEKIMPGNSQEEKILLLLENEALHLDELARMSNFNIGDLSARLTVMELKGMVKNIGSGVYKKT